MPSSLDRQLDAALAALGARLGGEPGGFVLVGPDDLQDGETGIVEALLGCGLLSQAEPAKAVICEGCEACCLMPVQFSATAPDPPDRCFVVCDKRDDIGRVAVETEQLRRWSASWHGVARFTAKTFGIAGEPIEVDPGCHWSLGETTLHRQRLEVVLAQSTADLPQVGGLVITLLHPGAATLRRSLGIGQAIRFRDGQPVPRKRALEEALAYRLDDPTVACEIRFGGGEIILVNHIAGGQRVIGRPHLNSSNDNAFQVLYDNPCRTFSLAELRANAKDMSLADLHKIVENLGFAGTLKKLFFRVSRNAIRFERVVTLGQLTTLGLDPAGLS